jgi:hypothetical protein
VLLVREQLWRATCDSGSRLIRVPVLFMNEHYVRLLVSERVRR